MTSLAFILGVLPLAISTGVGSASRHSTGTGLIAATALAIIFVPLFFRLVTRSVERKSKAGVAPSTGGEPK